MSAGEKASFDLLLDVVMKRTVFDSTIWCIDEPEVHLNTRIQGRLLEEIFRLIPEQSQLILASHSIGFMSKAWELQRRLPGEVVFLDFEAIDFDQPAAMTPTKVNRDFWRRTLDVALGDLASLVAPEQIVLCEGRPANKTDDKKAEFDARCYRRIFSDEFPNTDFVSVGNSLDVNKDRLELGRSIQALVSGTKLIRVVDRDLRTAEEVNDLLREGRQVLSRRHIEAYLLDDEVLAALCGSVGKSELSSAAIAVRDAALASSRARGNDVDDYKSATGEASVELRRLLGLTRSGTNWHAFATDILCPLIDSSMTVYKDLRRDIFNI